MNTKETTGAVAIAPQREMFGNLFPADSELGKATKRKVNKSGAVRLSLLPLSAKEGLPSLATLYPNAKGSALEAVRDRLSKDFTVKSSAAIAAATSSGQYDVGSMTLRKSGDIAIVLKNVGNPMMTKAQAIAQLTDAEREEIAKAYLENSEATKSE